MTLKYNLVSVGGESNLTLVHGGEMYVASDQHPNWVKITAGVLAGDESVVDLFDVAKTVAKHFETLSGRATVLNGELYFDGDIMHTALSTEVVRFLDEGVDDWKPLVAFLEKVMQNPQEHSREQLFEWLERNEFTLTSEGDIVGYKSVKLDGDVYKSIHSGTATVNGVEITGQIPQAVGDVVEMPRSAVAFDPSQGCSTGLHVANWKYASTWTTHAAVFAVSVNPRDVVSVPTDSEFQKVRVCRYKIIDIVDHVLAETVYAIAADDGDDDGYDYSYCDYCDEYGHDDDDCDDDDRDYFDDAGDDVDDDEAQEIADNVTAERVKDAVAASRAKILRARDTGDGNNRFW